MTEVSLIVVVAVDDESLNNELMQRVFHSQKTMKVHTLTSAEEALEFLAHDKAQLLLVDHSMPGMSGIELLRALRARGSDIPAVMVTAFPESKEVLEAWESGLLKYIVPKPWRSADLFKIVDRALARSKTAQK